MKLTYLIPSLFLLILIPLLYSSCGKDPVPEPQAEVITTLEVALTPAGSATPSVVLKFSDPDGEIGAMPPEVTQTGSFVANTIYAAALTLTNVTEVPPVNMTEEILAEKEDHLFCYSVDLVNLSISNFDLDANLLPVGITSTWTTGTASSGTVTVVLRHQPGLKTGACPGPGDTDISVTFDVTIP